VTAFAAQSEDVPLSMRRRIAAGLLALGIVIGSAVLWIGVPLGGFWLAGRITTDNVNAALFALLAVPLSMVAFGWLLYRLNDVYERLRGGRSGPAGSRSAWLVSFSDERARSRRARAPRTLIEVAMTASAVAAMGLLLFWFFFLAEHPIAPLP
jgi:hypothetical protein